MKVLAIFPDLRDVNPGGVQVSAEIAWEVLQRQTTARALFLRGKLGALTAARALDFDADMVLVWHLDFLRIAPFLRTRAPRVVFLHGIEAWRRHGWLTRRLFGSTRFIANSRYTIDRATPFIPQLAESTTDIVPLGIGTSGVVTAPLQSPPAAIMIGRLDAGERYKGHHEVIRAWPRVQRTHRDAQLWIVGDGSLREELEQEVRELALGNAVRFFGRVTEEEKHRLLVAARCLVLPSRGEGFGLVYLEAMRAGRPSLVGTDAGREVIAPPEAGLSVDPANADALSDAIVELLTLDWAWEQKSDSARRRYANQFTAAHFQSRLMSALQRTH